MIDYAKEQIVPILDAPKHMPGRPSIRSVWRYVQKGINGAKLETFKVGDKRFTSVEAIRRFVEHCSDPARPKRNGRRRERGINQAELELSKAGYC